MRFIGSGFGYEGDQPALKGKLCAMVNGFSLHAAVRIPRHRRDQLERLIRYTARSSVCMDRISLTERGNIIYELGSVWKNGITHVLLSPLELIEKLAAVVPLRNMHTIRISFYYFSNYFLLSSIISSTSSFTFLSMVIIPPWPTPSI